MAFTSDMKRALERVAKDHLSKEDFVSDDIFARLRRAVQAYLDRKASNLLRPKAIAEKYEKLSKHLHAARQVIQEMEPRADFQRALVSKFPNNDQWLDENYFDLGSIEDDLASYEKWIDAAFEEARGAHDKGGRQKDDSLEDLLLVLGCIFKDATGRRPTVSTDQYGNGQRYGPFLDLATAVLVAVDPNRQRSALGDTILKAQRTLKPADDQGELNFRLHPSVLERLYKSEYT